MEAVMAMIASRIRKAGHSYVVTIPVEEMKARGLHEGQLVGIDPVPVEIRPVAQASGAPAQLRPEVRAAADRVWARHAAGLRYLAGR
jgi:hypothetical protein